MPNCQFLFRPFLSLPPDPPWLRLAPGRRARQGDSFMTLATKDVRLRWRRMANALRSFSWARARSPAALALFLRPPSRPLLAKAVSAKNAPVAKASRGKVCAKVGAVSV